MAAKMSEAAVIESVNFISSIRKRAATLLTRLYQLTSIEAQLESPKGRLDVWLAVATTCHFFQSSQP